jgi:hypothetical protein
VLTKLKVNNTLYTDKKDILNITKDYYQNVYKSQNINSQTMNNYLDKIKLPKNSDKLRDM